MGLYDVPAIYTKVLAESGKEKLIYFGHSEGTSQMFVAGLDDSTRDFITAKTEKFFALAPVIFLNHVGSTLIDVAAKFNGIMYTLSSLIGLKELAPAECDIDHNRIWTEAVQWMCDNLKWFCDNSVPGFNFDERVDNALDHVDRLTDHFPSGTSAKAFEKYAQAMSMGEKKTFQKFDYGPLNMFHYGSFSPPKWDVAKWAIPTVLVVGTRDEFGTVEDNSNFASMVDVGLTKTYYMKDWDHYTFCFARNPMPLFSAIDLELGN